jgi:hypothetical protein
VRFAARQNDVQEFHPYVFQIFAQLIETRPAPLPAAYMAIFPPLLSPLFWERPGNVPALVRLLQVCSCRSLAWTLTLTLTLSVTLLHPDPGCDPHAITILKPVPYAAVELDVTQSNCKLHMLLQRALH